MNYHRCVLEAKRGQELISSCCTVENGIIHISEQAVNLIFSRNSDPNVVHIEPLSTFVSQLRRAGFAWKIIEGDVVLYSSQQEEEKAA